MSNYSLINVLVKRDGINRLDAIQVIREARLRVFNGENPETILYEEFGLEPDYVFDLLP